MIVGRPSDAPDRGNDPLRTYVACRADLLNKLCTDHTLWIESLRAFGRDASLAANWIDIDGSEQTSAVNGPFLRTHRRIVRSVLRDLLDCGPLGVAAIEDVFSQQATLLEQGTFD